MDFDEELKKTLEKMEERSRLIESFMAADAIGSAFVQAWLDDLMTEEKAIIQEYVTSRLIFICEEMGQAVAQWGRMSAEFLGSAFELGLSLNLSPVRIYDVDPPRLYWSSGRARKQRRRRYQLYRSNLKGWRDDSR